uniref:Uncharacterized protein n=1 Tax=Globodera rostochiensis TaxID=31243 RepID=A0A914HE42_GLORO
MNHCIPNRKLQPEGAPIHNGVIITLPSSQNIVHFVFRDKDSPLFAMHKKLFVCKNPYGLKNAQILRHEKTLEFGDTIVFTADEETNTVIDYEKGLQVFETDCNYGKYLVKCVCILPPLEKDPLRCWCDHFGWIQLSMEQCNELHQRAEPDVPINTWVSIEVHGDRIVPEYHDFIDVAVDERKNVWDVEWNLHNENRPKGNAYKWEITDDEEDDEPDFIEKSEDQLLDVKLKLEGCLIDKKELYCNELKDHRVFVGLWKKHECKPDNVPLGRRCNFDAYFNDIRGVYIAYFCEFGEDDDEDWVCEVFLPEVDNEPPVIGVTIYPSETWGALYKTSFFGLVSDKNRMLGTLPYMFFNEKLRQEEEEEAAADAAVNGDDLEDAEEYTGEILIYIVDTGPAKHKLCRFKFCDSQPNETLRLVEKANQLAAMETIKADGFIYNSYLQYVYVPKYPTQQFIFPAEYIREFPVGYWFDFEAKFVVEKGEHEILGARLDEQRDIVPHNRIDERMAAGSGPKIQRYEFKIEVELCAEEFAKEQLFNAMYGFVADPEAAFQTKKRTKKYKVIIGEGRSRSDVTHFKFLRMAGNEKLMFERKPRAADIPYNEDTVAGDGDDNDLFADIGLDPANAEEEDKPLTQVDYLQEYSIRERKLKARERKRERDKKEKQLLEALRLQEETRVTAADAPSSRDDVAAAAIGATTAAVGAATSSRA